MPSSSGIPESSIVFFVGGHNHDGESSTLIDTDQYSIYDWNIGVTSGSGQRGQRQDENAASFRLLIDSIVKETTLGPSGIRLMPNSITGLHINSGTITANELSANIILVNNVIRSNNFDGNVAANGSITSAGTAGWAIAGDGTAFFDSSYIRGAIEADSVITPGVDILANGAIVSTNFNVSPGGNITATNASISGTITASAIGASTFFIDSLNYWTSDGEFNVGTAGNFLSFDGTDLLLSGAVNATSGNIGGWVINGTVLQSNNAATILNPNGDIDLAGQLDATGNINTGANMNISGSVTANTSFNVLGQQGVYYPTVAGSVGVASRGISFYWNGTNVYARLYNSTNGTYQDVCLSNCGTGTTSAPATTTASTTTTLAPGGGGNGGGTTTTVNQTTVPGGCAEGTVIPSNLCSPACPQDFDCICSSGGNYCIG